ncbi:MAG TPA: hypothetical protein VFW39_12865 [Sphingomicrobium sp.]|nr:hypothetical protein [Sphingomicrobium sp.]
MRHRTVTIPASPGIDWKGIGYLFSIAGVLLMGAEAIPKPTDPWWYWPALAGGIVTSIIGFGLRYMAHLKERREMAEVKKEAASS